MSVPVVFDRNIHLHYRQFYVESRTTGFFDGLTEALGGQVNGLCGAAVPGFLFLTTGLHTGQTRVAVELLDAPPPLGADWEDVVEVSFRPATAKAMLAQWAGEATWPLPLEPISYRLRYNATGMDQAWARDNLPSGEPLLDRYLLQFWPAPPAPDAVLRETSRAASYWHAHARKQPRPPSPQERAETARREQAAREHNDRIARDAFEARQWDGRLPDERLRRVNGALELARLDRPLMDWITGLTPAAQRAIAVWAARRACAAANLTVLGWVQSALAALDRGNPLPFGDIGEAFRLLDADRNAPSTSVASYDGRFPRVSQQHAAVPSLWSAAANDPLAAAIESIFHAIVTYGVEYRRLLTDARNAVR